VGTSKRDHTGLRGLFTRPQVNLDEDVLPADVRSLAIVGLEAGLATVPGRRPAVRAGRHARSRAGIGTG